MRPFILSVCLLGILAGRVSAAPDSSRQAFHLNEAAENELGYSRAYRAGGILYVSGATGGGAMPDAIRHAYGTIRQVLAAHGLTFRDIVKETVYTTDLDLFAGAKDVRKEFFTPEYPAATWVQVQRLIRPTYCVEIEVIAAFPNPSNPKPEPVAHP